MTVASDSSGVKFSYSLIVSADIGKKEIISATTGERNNTIACCFDPRSPRINAFQIYEWINECLQIPEDNILMIQTDASKRHVYIKFTREESMNKVLQATGGQMEFKHDSGEITQVNTEIAGMGLKKVRIANLPPETREYYIRASQNTEKLRTSGM